VVQKNRFPKESCQILDRQKEKILMTFRSELRRLLFATAFAIPVFALAVPQAQAGIFVSVNFAPPALPVYVQPPLPAPGYLWTPGYWGYGDAGYYWVPGVWVQPPTVGFLWTPGYWGFAGGFYGWHGGYWGPHVGFYGGVNYGFGYGGVGFFGGEWRGGAFAYNRAVANFGSVHVTNVYENRTVIEQNTIVNANHTSFNGPGGIARQPSAQESQFANERHIQPTANQVQHQNFASQDRAQLASVNKGRPAMTAASSVNAYHQVAQQHAQSQPISAADRDAGLRNNPNGSQPQRTASSLRSNPATTGEAAHTNTSLRSSQVTPGTTAHTNTSLTPARTNSSSLTTTHNNVRPANGSALNQQPKPPVSTGQNNSSRPTYSGKQNAPASKPSPKGHER
jgi:hypothetical protein